MLVQTVSAAPKRNYQPRVSYQQHNLNNNKNASSNRGLGPPEQPQIWLTAHLSDETYTQSIRLNKAALRAKRTRRRIRGKSSQSAFLPTPSLTTVPYTGPQNSPHTGSKVPPHPDNSHQPRPFPPAFIQLIETQLQNTRTDTNIYIAPSRAHRSNHPPLCASRNSSPSHIHFEAPRINRSVECPSYTCPSHQRPSLDVSAESGVVIGTHRKSEHQCIVPTPWDLEACWQCEWSTA
jgi:hypothetical protein